MPREMLRKRWEIKGKVNIACLVPAGVRCTSPAETPLKDLQVHWLSFKT